MLKNLKNGICLSRDLLTAALLALAGLSLVACGKDSGGANSAGVTTQAFGLSARAQDRAIILSWPRINDAKKYSLYWSLTPDARSTGTKIPNVTAPYTHSGLNNGTPVYYVFTVETSAGEGAESVEISLAPKISATREPKYPEYPQYVEAFGRDGRVELLWEGVTNATSYNVYRKTSRGVTVGDTKLADATSPLVLTGLQNGQAYYFAVLPVFNDRESALSNEVVAVPYTPETITFTPDETLVPQPPQHVHAYAGHNQVTISADDQSDALRYTIYWSTSSGVSTASSLISNVALPYTLIGLADGTPYYFKVIAKNQHGGSVLVLSAEVSSIPNNHTIESLVAAGIDPVLRNCITASAAHFGWKFQRQMDRVDCESSTTFDLLGLEKFSNLSYLYLSQTGGVSHAITGISALEKLTNLQELGLRGAGVVDLKFLSGLINLTWLDLSYNPITSISQLSSLQNLAKLWLVNTTKLSDYQPLADLWNLQTVSLAENNLIDLAPIVSALEKLSNLTTLYLDSNPNINNYPTLARLTKLQELSLTSNTIVDLVPLTSALESLNNFTTFYLYDNPGITDYAPLAALVKLQELWLDYNKIADLTQLGNAFANMNQLARLHLDSNGFSDLNPLKNLHALTELSVANNRVADLTPLQDLTGLTKLWVGHDPADTDAQNRITTLEPLSNLTELTELHFENNAVGALDLLPLQKHTNLQTLAFTNNQIASLDALQNMTRLRNLYAGSNKIRDIDLANHANGVSGVISGLTNLQVLYLENNLFINNISSLYPLTQLQALNLSDDTITDVAPLAEMVQLTELNLYNNHVADISPLAGLVNLETLDLSYNDLGNAASNLDSLIALTKATELKLLGYYGGVTLPCVGLYELINGPNKLVLSPVYLDSGRMLVDTFVYDPGVTCANY